MENNNFHLKSCPFCGEAGKLIILPQTISNFVAGCDNRLCWVEPKTGSFDTQAEAENAWNVRNAELNE